LIWINVPEAHYPGRQRLGRGITLEENGGEPEGE